MHIRNESRFGYAKKYLDSLMLGARKLGRNVNRARLSPRLQLQLNALGHRLEKAGQERVAITGVLHSAADSQSREIAATLEYPDRLRLVFRMGRKAVSAPSTESKPKLTPVTSI